MVRSPWDGGWPGWSARPLLGPRTVVGRPPRGRGAADPESTMEQEVWLFDLPANTNRQLTFDPLLERSPIWKDDSGGILFTLGGGPSSVYELSVGRTERPRVLIQAGRSP